MKYQRNKVYYEKEKIKIVSLNDVIELKDKRPLPIYNIIKGEKREELCKQLTNKQFVVFVLLEYGFLPKEIAKIMNVGINSIYRYVWRIKQKGKKIR